MATSFQVTFDCANPKQLGQFWATVLGYEEDAPPSGFATWPDYLRAAHVPEKFWEAAYAVVDPTKAGSRLYFQRVPEPKAVKNRLHLDINVSGGRALPLEQRRQNVAAAVERFVQAGATKIQEKAEGDSYWVVMADPESNEFCLH